MKKRIKHPAGTLCDVRFWKSAKWKNDYEWKTGIIVESTSKDSTLFHVLSGGQVVAANRGELRIPPKKILTIEEVEALRQLGIEARQKRQQRIEQSKNLNTISPTNQMNMHEAESVDLTINLEKSES